MEPFEKSTIKSISPSLIRSLSPIRATSRLKNYHHTREKIANISKCVFKTSIDQHPILTLEKAVLRGRGKESDERKRSKVSKGKIPSNLENYLKSEHKVKNIGTQIIKLPRLPYGFHQTYNEEEGFVDTHFVTEVSESEKQKEVFNLTKKFKLNDRIKAKRNHSLKNSIGKDKNKSDLYRMESGILVVKKEQRIVDLYEHDKGKYVVKHHYVHQTFREIGINLDIDLGKKNIMTEILDQDTLLKRMHQRNRSEKQTELSKHFTTKYSALFMNA